MGAPSFETVALKPQTLPDFLERHWSRLLSGEVLFAPTSEVEDPGARFDCFEELSNGRPSPVRRYAMRLRDGSRIRAIVDERQQQVRFERDLHDPAAGVASFLRYAVSESTAARRAAQCVAAFRSTKSR